MVSDWLKANMFDNDGNKDAIVDGVIKELGSHALTLSHDRHIPIDILKDKLGLKILLLEDDNDLQDKVLSVHHSCIISLTQTPAFKIIENQEGKAFIQLIK